MCHSIFLMNRIAPLFENMHPKGVSFSDFIAIFAMSYQSFACLDLQH